MIRRTRPVVPFFTVFPCSLILLIILSGVSRVEAISPLSPTSRTETEAPAPLLTIDFIDVGQGDAILLRSGGKNVLIDAGDDNKDAGKIILAFLKKKKIKKIDTAVITHPHRDHFGGFIDLVAKFPIGEFLYSTDSLYFIDLPGSYGDKTILNDLVKAIHAKGIPYNQVHYGDTFDWGAGIKVEVLHTSEGVYSEPSEDEFPPTANDFSLVFKVTAGDVSFLFTGDLEARGEAAMEARWGKKLRSDVLKVGHHGSRSSSSQAFLKVVSPGFGVIQVGANNQFNHPSASTIQALQAMSIVTYRTDHSGTITSRTDGKAVEFSLEHSGSLRDLVASAGRLDSMSDRELAGVHYEAIRSRVAEKVRCDLSAGNLGEIIELLQAPLPATEGNLQNVVRDMLRFEYLHR